ncbi:MAG: AAA family ATPase [Treponema sp.]|uniref:Flagellar biosynthesis protein FlhG n=1 Tax=Treponema rectale TaxID=744512 RepID=A0A840SCU1_9SPIR|nr:P-loop NTPase [Treponema rectale]MBB5218664.1 flagellar biosynthesis protein FlhG [Treponema rectale]MBO6176768.1 AAA family ATPase [Treponema sp.]
MQIIPIASGKGGVGKSLLSANLAITLGQAGKKVLLVDLDLGASNLHLVIGQQSPKNGIGTFLTGQTKFEDIVMPTDYENVWFIAGDSEIPGLTSLKVSQKNELIKSFTKTDYDYLILDLGAGTHLTILDMFLLSPQGIVVTAPTVTATLNGYLFLKNIVFRMMYNTFKKNSKAYEYLETLKKDTASLQRLYIPKLIEILSEKDPESTELFKKRMAEFRPRLVLNMIDDPKDAERAQKIRRSCQQYLGLDLEHLGVIYRDTMQDKALSSRLPVVVYKPQSILSQAVYRIAEKIMQSEARSFDDEYDLTEASDISFDIAAEEAGDDFGQKMAYVEELAGTGALTAGELAETLRQQQYEITQLRNENTLLKKKLLDAARMGFKV